MTNNLTVPVTALVITKNEARAVKDCLTSLRFCDQIVVIDSDSEDATVAIAQDLGAEVVNFVWNRRYPKKKQWAMELDLIRNDWVLHVDADEIVSRDLAEEIGAKIRSDSSISAFDIPIEYFFLGKRLRYGHRVHKRSLVRRSQAAFPEVGDLGAPGITEVEGHYQPSVNGTIGRLKSRLVHDDPDPLSDWLARHNRYSDWEAYLLAHPDVRNAIRQRRSSGGQIFDHLPFKSAAFFTYSFVIKLGFLDGRAGFDYAFALSWYYWTISAKRRDAIRNSERPLRR